MRTVLSISLLAGLFSLATGCTHREHPYLAFDKADIPSLRERALHRPYIRWMAAVEANAQCGLKFTPGQANSPCPSTSTVPPGLTCPWANGATNEACQSGYAFNLALANTIKPNSDYVQKAVELLSNAGKYEQNWQRNTGAAWYWGGDLQGYAFAYDMVQPYLTAQQDRTIVAALTRMVRDTMAQFVNPFNTAIVTNIRLRVGSGAATLAIALDHHEMTALWAKKIEESFFTDGSKLRPLFNKYVASLVTEQGTMNEGPSYQNDAFVIMLPYLYVLNRVHGRDYINGKNTLPGWNGDNRLAFMFERNAALSMPDKNSATVTTGWRNGFTLANISAPGIVPPGNEQMQWFFAWQEGSGAINQVIPGFSFLYVDSQIPKDEPTYLSLVTPDWTSFRNGWNYDSLYFLMQSEYWPEASAHGQPDQTSFILYAKDRYLLIDPGDGRNYCVNMNNGCTAHSQISRSPEAHNLVIVDDKRGCDDDNQTPARLLGSYTRTRDPVTLLAGFVSPELSSSMITLQKYHNSPDVSTYRTAMMARGRYVVVFDGMVSSSRGTAHTYDAKLHFGGPVSNTDATCQAAQSGASESCGPNDSDNLCWAEPLRDETAGPDPDTYVSSGDEGNEPAPKSCIKTQPPSLPPGVVDCGSTVGTLDLGAAGSDRLKWLTKSNKGDDIELSAVFAPAPASFAKGLFPTNFYGNAVFTHPFATARYSGYTTQWLNVLFPRNLTTKESPAVITPVPITGGNGAASAVKFDAETMDDLALVSDGAAVISAGDEVSFQGRAALLLRTAGQWTNANVHAASSLSIKGAVVYSANPAGHAMLAWTNRDVHAQVQVSESTRVCLAARSASQVLAVDNRVVESIREGLLLCAPVSAGKHELLIRD